MANADAERFGRRAATYHRGWRGEFHTRVVATSADLALRVAPRPTVVLDVGCGTGALLRTLAARLPAQVELIGVDPAPAMVEAARAALAGPAGGRVECAPAEHLPLPDARVDLVVSTVSFHHWEDRVAGLREVARVLRPEGRLVLVDHFAIGWLRAFDAVARRQLPSGREVAAAGLTELERGRVFDLGPLPLIRAIVAARGDGDAQSVR
jgi:ubiquinone/menaquinone biosynthesis C-methylase UbiE